MVGWVSVVVLPGRGRAGAAVPGGAARAGRRIARRHPACRACARRCTTGAAVIVLAVALVGGLDAVEEYFPVMADDWGVGTTAVPFAVLVSRWPGPRAPRSAAAPTGCPRPAARRLLVARRLCWPRRGVGPAGRAGRGRGLLRLYLAVLVVAETRLQERIEAARATVTSVAGLGIEVAALAVFAAWALAADRRSPSLVLAVVPVVPGLGCPPANRRGLSCARSPAGRLTGSRRRRSGSRG